MPVVIFIQKMPKTETTTSAKLKEMVRSFPELRTDGQVLTCSLCNHEINYSRFFLVERHLDTVKHVKLRRSFLEDQHQQQMQQQPQQQQIVKMDSDSSFAMDLVDMCISSNIPLDKLKEPSMTVFLQKYLGKDCAIPSFTLIQDHCIPRMFDEFMTTIREAVQDKFLWVSISGTVDSKTRYEVNVVIGVMEKDGKMFLLKSTKTTQGLLLTDTFIVALYHSALDSLGADFDKDRVLLVLTDTTDPAMISAGTMLCKANRKLIHVTCVFAAFNEVIDQILNEFEAVEQLISRFELEPFDIPELRERLSFDKRSEIFMLKAAIYVGHNYRDLAQQLQYEEGMGLGPYSLPFEFLVEAMESLESNDATTLAMSKAIDIFDKVQQGFKFLGCGKSTSISIANSWNEAFNKNGGLQMLLRIGKNTTLGIYSAEEIEAFKWVRLATVVADKTFPAFKDFYKDNQTSDLTGTNLYKTFLMSCSLY